STTTSTIIFFLIDRSTSMLSPLSLHDALPISIISSLLDLALSIHQGIEIRMLDRGFFELKPGNQLDNRHKTIPIKRGPSHFATADRKSTRLNSSHVKISYAVFCLKKKRNKHIL